MYALVKDGVVIRTTNDTNIEWNGFTYSNVNLLSTEERLAAGIFPILKENLERPEGMKECGSKVTVGEFSVVETPLFFEKSVEELASEQEALIRQYESALDGHLDAVAVSYRYTNGRYSFASRSGYPNPDQALAQAFGTWMDECNLKAKTLLSQVLGGVAEMPTVEDFIAMLPEFAS